MIKLTKTLLRARLGTPDKPANDAQIARFFGISQSAVHQWGDDQAQIPEARAMAAALKRPDLFGLQAAEDSNAA